VSNLQKINPPIASGKTKKIWGVVADPNTVIVENTDSITKNNDPSQTRKMHSKGEMATDTTSNVFELLKIAGIPVAFRKQISPTEFLADNCQMIPLEVVGRRYAAGSYLKRYPNLQEKEGDAPFMFHRWEYELFLKTTNGIITDIEGNNLGTTLVDDPLVMTPNCLEWVLTHPKIPSWESGANLGKNYAKEKIIGNKVKLKEIEEIARKVFLVIEGAFAQLGVKLIDIKIEFGITKIGKIVVADVIDNDSWRLRDEKWEELSKQLFRDNTAMNVIEDKYALVAQLTKRFHIPRQALVFWKGSASDSSPDIPTVAGIDVIEVTLSGHKSPNQCLERLKTVIQNYPEGGVILSIVGMSNGLGPTIAARTNWPTIAIPTTVKNQPHDIWSSLEMPGNVPLCTVLSHKNAVLAALNILAQKNPVAYMKRQATIESLDR